MSARGTHTHIDKHLRHRSDPGPKGTNASPSSQSGSGTRMPRGATRRTGATIVQPPLKVHKCCGAALARIARGTRMLERTTRTIKATTVDSTEPQSTPRQADDIVPPPPWISMASHSAAKPCPKRGPSRSTSPPPTTPKPCTTINASIAPAGIAGVAFEERLPTASLVPERELSNMAPRGGPPRERPDSEARAVRKFAATRAPDSVQSQKWRHQRTCSQESRPKHLEPSTRRGDGQVVYTKR